MLFATLSPGPGAQAADVTDKQMEDAVSEAVHSLDKITESWEEGRYDELYDRGTKDFRASMMPEQFSVLMRTATRSPECCFKRFQEAKGQFNDLNHIEVTVTIGYRYSMNAISRGPSAPVLPQQERESFSLVREGDRWRLDLNQVLDRAWIPGRRY
jgi:hypothetical protein